MATKVYVIGANELAADFARMARIIKDEPALITSQLDHSMSRFAHVITGDLAGSTYHRGREAGADMPYAGYEADRGGDHDFAEQAIDDFDLDKYADEIVAPF